MVIFMIFFVHQTKVFLTDLLDPIIKLIFHARDAFTGMKQFSEGQGNKTRINFFRMRQMAPQVFQRSTFISESPISGFSLHDMSFRCTHNCASIVFSAMFS